MPTEPDRTPLLGALVGALLAGLVGGLGLGVAARLLPAPALRGGEASFALGAAAWWLAGTAVAAPVAAAGTRWRALALPTAAAWVVASAAVAVGDQGWALSPSRSEFLELGPALSLWLLAALPWIVLPAAGHPSPAAVLTRAVVVWGAGYGGLWVAITPTQLSSIHALPTPVLAAVVAAAAAFWGLTVGIAGVVAGPLRPREQVLSFVLAHPFLVVIGPDIPRTLRQLQGQLQPEAIGAVGVVALVPLLGAAGGSVAAWLWARHRERAAAA